MARENVKKLHFTEQVNGTLLCEFCKHEFAKGTSSTRLRAHLTRESGKGAKICPLVPQDVKDSLQSNKRQRTTTSASVGVQLGQQIESSSTFQTNTLQATYSMAMVAETTQANESGNKSETSSNPHQIQSGANNHCTPSFLPEVNNDFGNIGQHNHLVYDHEIDETYPCLAEMLENMISTPPNESGSVESLLLPDVTNFQARETSEGVIGWTRQPVERGSTHQPDPPTTTDLMLPNESCSNLQLEAFPPTDLSTQDLRNCPRLVGEAFVKNEEKIWSWLMDDQVLRVDIYGMGGVGKTTLMRRIQTRLKDSLKVYWVTVSQDFSICKLQNLIAKKIGFNFLEEEDVVERAEELTQSLKAKGKCVLILDDLWNYFNIDQVGIPVEVNACKLVLTTRDLKVCRQMVCSKGNRIQLKPLSKEEAWILFTQELGDYIPEVEELAKAISGECDGLPLGIKVMARTMKEIREVHAWRNALEELKEVKSLQMRDEVFSVLKFSFDRLKDPAWQKCLLYCALFPEDAKIGRDELIKYMIAEGIINERSRQARLDKGYTVLDTLQNACLLEGDNDNVWMHDLIRDMAIDELRERFNTLVEAGSQLKELPDVEKWREDLVRVSLIGNELGVIPYCRHTRRCPNLSTLLLRDNRQLERITKSFFKQFQKLKVLDLSRCLRIEVLPRSISNLVNLTALLLSGCSSLSYVPSLVKLEKLEMLDLCGCGGLKKMPEGVKFLPKLNYLDLSLPGTRESESEISKFVRREVGELRMLETLYCDFRNLKEFEEYIESQKRSQRLLSHYNFNINIWVGWQYWESRRATLKSVSIRDISFIDPLRLPTDIEALSIKDCGSTFYKRLFPPTSNVSCLINLQEICVERWDGIEEIFAVKEDNINTALVQFREDNINTAPVQFREDNINTALVQCRFPYHSTHSLSNLKVIDILRCNKLKKLFPPSLLPNLQEITVRYCNGMEEIFSTDQEDGEELSFGQSINNNHYPPNPASTSTVSTGLNLPKLTKLELEWLPELRSIYKGEINCHSLQVIALAACPKMERITLPLPQRSLRIIRVYPKKWWESVQWGSANDKIHLQSFVGFKIYECW